MNKIIFLDYQQNFFTAEQQQRLRTIAGQTLFVSSKDKGVVQKEVHDAQMIVVQYFTIVDKELIDSAPSLAYIGTSAISTAAIDVVYARSKGIIVSNTAGYCSNAIAEFVLGALLAHIRQLGKARECAVDGDFTTEQYLGWELQGKLFGIVGLGNIGRRIADITSGIGMHVTYYSRTRNAAYEKKGVQFRGLEQLAAEADVLGVCVPEAILTQGLISKHVLQKLKSGSMIVSISHTSVFDFASLLRVMGEQKITLIQTYFSTIPNEQRNALLGCKSVVLYPSIAIRTQEALNNRSELLLNNIEAFVAGRPQHQVRE
jgi:D-3-phosphoglycerate dehydrogenase